MKNGIITSITPKKDGSPISEKSSLLVQFESTLTPTTTNADEAMRILTLIRERNIKNIQPPKPPLKYPVFQGGGAKGAAYIGAYQALDEQGFLNEIECPGGSSAGGIPAFFMSLGFDSEQFKYISNNINFRDFTDLKKNGWGEWLNGSSIGTLADVVRYGAASPGKSFHDWASYFVEQVLGDKNATFSDLHEKKLKDPSLKDLLLTATRYGTKDGVGALQIFSYETTPNVVIADAFRATIAYPSAFEPWQVREKVLQKDQHSFKSLGFFADGGILNNLPVSSYNHQYYYDPIYQPLERHDQHGSPVQVNPSVVGFSLTSLEELDNEITPLPMRIRSLHEQAKRKLPVEEKPKSHPSWRFSDIAKAALWNKIGKPEAESINDKQKIYYDQTVQIWTENVSTLEFDISKEKLSTIVKNGKDATDLWLKRFRNPKEPYSFKPHFDDRLTKSEERQKLRAPRKFYFLKLRELFLDAIREMQKQQTQRAEDESILDNVRLSFLSDQIVTLCLQARQQAIDVTEDAFHDACVFHDKQCKKLAKTREKRWEALLPKNIVENISINLTQDREKALRIFQGQLGNIISLVEYNQGELLTRLAETNDTKLVGKAINIILNALNQAYYQGKIRNPIRHLAKLLNASPSLIKRALLNNNMSMLKLFLDHGAEVELIHPSTETHGLQEAINLSHYAGFKAMVMLCGDEDTSIYSIKIGKEFLLHYILKKATDDFIKQLVDDRFMLEDLMHDATDEAGKNILHVLGESDFSPSVFANILYTGLSFNRFSPSFTTQRDAANKSPLFYLFKYNRQDILQQLLDAGKGKNSGYFSSDDYFLDQIFKIPDAQYGSAADYDDLVYAYQHAPKLYHFFMNNISNQEKSDKIHQKIINLTKIPVVEQPAPKEVHWLEIRPEPVIFSRMSNKSKITLINKYLPIDDEMIPRYSSLRAAG